METFIRGVKMWQEVVKPKRLESVSRFRKRGKTKKKREREGIGEKETKEKSKKDEKKLARVEKKD